MWLTALLHYWHKDDTPQSQRIRLANKPDTLSGDILRLPRNLPLLNGNYERIGDQIHALENTPLPPNRDNDSEDASAILASLPVTEVYPQ